VDASITVTGLMLQGAALGITAATSPGPFQTFLISESLSGGWRRGMPIAFAPLISDVPIVVITLLVLQRLPDVLLRGLSLVGGLFVLYLAWGLWRRWRSGLDAASDTSHARSSLRRGALVNFLSPGPYLFWTLVNGPILIAALGRSILHGGAFLVGFYGVMIGTLLAIAGLFHQARRFGPRVVRGLLLLSVGILIVFAGVLFRQALAG
jgi:threonine/homoserine/homoserine lactone efflux protein